MNKLDKKIEESKNMPKELKDKIDETFFYNNLEAITMMFYFAILNYAFLMCTVKDFTNYCKIFSIYAAIISVVIFEVAYKKDRFKLAIIGIEVLVTERPLELTFLLI